MKNGLARVWPQGSTGPKYEGDAAEVDNVIRKYNDGIARLQQWEQDRLAALRPQQVQQEND